MTDPYFDTQFCVDRLYNEWRQHKRLIVAVDYDDTIFDFHSKGYKYPMVIDLIQKCQQNHNFYIVIFTGTAPEKWPAIIEHCFMLGIKVDSINKNPIPLPFGNDGKIYYNILLDDRSGLGQSYSILNQLIETIVHKG